MKLLKIYSHKKSGLARRSTTEGFTLLEMIITIGILAIIASLGLFMSMDQYRSYTLSAERDTVVAMLQKARNQAMNNIRETPHGLSIQSSNYTIFHGASYASRNTSYDEIFPKSGFITTGGVGEVVFNQLRGNVTTGSGNMTLSSNAKVYTISINSEGRINW